MMRYALLCSFLFLSCIRPSDEYDVRLHSLGVPLDEVQDTAEPMGGRIELARYRLWGSNLGHGVTGFFGDEPRADGTEFAIGSAMFGFPKDPTFDRNSAFVDPGPKVEAGSDACAMRLGSNDDITFSEYIDVGDEVSFSHAEGERFRLARDPSFHPRPAGESWYVGYGGTLEPVIQDHADHPGNWRPGGLFDLSFPGTVLPPESTVGAVPYPLSAGSIGFPSETVGLAIGGEPVRAPQHGEDGDDDVRFEGPWQAPMVLSWEPSASRAPLTITVRYLGEGVESECGCSADCGAGFTCELDTGSANGVCVGDEGAGWVVLGELTCTVEDDGEFVLQPADMAALNAQASPDNAVLLVSRISESKLDSVADARTPNGLRVPISPVRVRVVDTIVTRLDRRPEGAGQ